MKININYKSSINHQVFVNQAFFVNENYNTNNLKNFFSASEVASIKEIIKNIAEKKNIINFNLNSKKKIFLINIKNNLKTFEIENLGALFYEVIKDASINDLLMNTSFFVKKEENDYLSFFLHGLKLKSYEFNKYKTNKKQKVFSLTLLGKKLDVVKKKTDKI